jgi:putative aldouronate transport system substrate-binding protein
VAGLSHFGPDALLSLSVVQPLTSRRQFLALLGSASYSGLAGVALGAGAALSGCHKRASNTSEFSRARDVAAVLPRYSPLELVPPDIAGEGCVPSGYLKYPSALVDAVREKPGRSTKAIKTMTPFWGPTPPGLGRNSFLEAVNAQLGVPIRPSVQDGMSYADKLSAVLGARDVPDILCAPNWEIDKIPRFAAAVRALFTDLGDYLQGDAVAAYPMLATLPTSAWQYCVWGGRLSAIPFPADGPFPLGLFYRKDLCDRASVTAPRTIDELYAFGKRMTQPERGVWAFGTLFNMVQMFFKCPGSKNGWGKRASGGLVFKYELPEFRQALEFTARLYREGLVHPDLVATRGADAKQLFNSGKILMYEDGIGAWRGMQSEQAKVTPGYNMQPVPIFSAVGGDPLAWQRQEPIFYTFVKKGLPAERTLELLRVLNWCAAPFGSQEYELASRGVEGKHFTRGHDGSPIPTELGRNEISDQYTQLGGRFPVVVSSEDVPQYVRELLAYTRTTAKHIEPDLFQGIKLQLPGNYSKNLVLIEDQLTDIVRGRRPESDLGAIVQQWRATGGDEARAYLEKALSENS